MKVQNKQFLQEDGCIVGVHTSALLGATETRRTLDAGMILTFHVGRNQYENYKLLVYVLYCPNFCLNAVMTKLIYAYY